MAGLKKARRLKQKQKQKLERPYRRAIVGELGPELFVPNVAAIETVPKVADPVRFEDVAPAVRGVTGAIKPWWEQS